MKTAVFCIKFAIIALLTGHIVYLAYATLYGSLGPNPVESLSHTTGQWGLWLLLLSLSITPLRRLFSWNVLMRFRRLLGVSSFIYLLLHTLVFVIFDHSLYWPDILDDIFKRPYITAGFAAFVLMVPLAITSTAYWQRQMGRYWQVLHRLVYPVALLAIVHCWVLAKADMLLPLIYALVLSVLLLIRGYFMWLKRIKPNG